MAKGRRCRASPRIKRRWKNSVCPNESGPLAPADVSSLEQERGTDGQGVRHPLQPVGLCRHDALERNEDSYAERFTKCEYPLLDVDKGPKTLAIAALEAEFAEESPEQELPQARKIKSGLTSRMTAFRRSYDAAAMSPQWRSSLKLCSRTRKAEGPVSQETWAAHSKTLSTNGAKRSQNGPIPS